MTCAGSILRNGVRQADRRNNPIPKSIISPLSSLALVQRRPIPRVIVIPVESVAEIPGYAAPEAAIAAAKGHALQPKARQDATRFTGQQFVDAWWDLGQWVLEFSGPLWLRVFAAGDFVNWAVEQAKPDVAAVAGQAV